MAAPDLLGPGRLAGGAERRRHRHDQCDLAADGAFSIVSIDAAAEHGRVRGYRVGGLRRWV